jgi:transposase
MNVGEKSPGDIPELERRIRTESNAKQRDRLRCVLLALQKHETEEIARTVGRVRTFVQRWVYAYRDGGLEAVRATKQPGRRPLLPRERHQEFKQRVLAGPTAADGGVCVLRGQEVQAILEREFGVSPARQTAYDLLHRVGLSSLKPAARHPKNDPAAMQASAKAPPFCPRRRPSPTGKENPRLVAGRSPRRTARNPDPRVGRMRRPPDGAQTDRVRIRPALRGVLPGDGSVRGVDRTGGGHRSDEHPPGVHRARDRAGRARGAGARQRRLAHVQTAPGAGQHHPAAPAGLLAAVESDGTAVGIPAPTPPSNRVYADYAAILDACTDAWRHVTPDRFRSVCRADWLAGTPANY